MEWSKEETIRLIETYQKRDLIWDQKHVNHYNKHRKEDEWEEIGKEMGTSVDACKKKMEYLLSALRREKMKMKRNSCGSGKGIQDAYISSWFAFDSLKFLWNKNKPKPTVEASETTEMPTQEPVNYENNPYLAIPLKEDPEPSDPKSPTLKRKKQKTLADQRLNEAFQILVTSANQVNDENQHFGNLIACKLRNYDERVRSLIQNDILNIFIRANRGSYNSVPSLSGDVAAGPHTLHSIFPPNYSYTDSFQSHDSGTASVQPSPSNSTCSLAEGGNNLSSTLTQINLKNRDISNNISEVNTHELASGESQINNISQSDVKPDICIDCGKVISRTEDTKNEPHICLNVKEGSISQFLVQCQTEH